MKIKPIYAIVSLVIVLLLCGITWEAFRPKDKETNKIYKTVSSTGDTSHPPQTAETAPPEKEAPTSEERAEQSKEVTLEERAEQSKEITLEALQVLRGTKTDPFMEKLQKAMETPAYQEYLRKSQETQGTAGLDLTLWWDFLESQGLGSGRILQERKFAEFFPGGGASSDYEPDMRKKFAELALENPDKNTAILLGEFWQDRANYIWTRQHFNGHAGDFDWADNIRQNAGSILAEFAAVAEETALPVETDAPILEQRAADVAEETEGSRLPTRLDPGASRQLPEREAERATALPSDILEDLSTLPNAADFQQRLRERFSPKRFDTAMQTVTQYGPEEGLRRLKESDPEIAPFVERFVERFLEDSKETD